MPWPFTRRGRGTDEAAPPTLAAAPVTPEPAGATPRGSARPIAPALVPPARPFPRLLATSRPSTEPPGITPTIADPGVALVTGGAVLRPITTKPLAAVPAEAPVRSAPARAPRATEAPVPLTHLLEEPQPASWPTEELPAPTVAPRFEEFEEELPPPIFSSILAERTGRSLGEIRPDLADGDGEEWQAGASRRAEARDPSPTPTGRRSLAESRRLGLGAPMHSPGADELTGETPAPHASVPSDASAGRGHDPFRSEEPAQLRPEPSREPEPEPEPAPPPGSASVRYEPPAPARERVSASVRGDVTRALGVDVGDVEIHRDAAAGERARALGARAFTTGGDVFVPPDAGPLDTPRVRGLIAHELTHVIQQRQLPSMPVQDSELGRRLEAQARAVERFASGADSAPKVPMMRVLPATAGDPFVDAAGHERQIAEHLVVLAPTEIIRSDHVTQVVSARPTAAGGASDQPWRAVAEAEADAELLRVLREDDEAAQRWRMARQGTSDQTEIAQLDADETRRRARFMEEYGDRAARLHRRQQATSGAGVGSGPTNATESFEQRDVAAHEMFSGLMTEGASGLDLGMGDFFGQFEQRSRRERDEIEHRIARYEQAYTSDLERNPGETQAAYEARLARPELAWRVAAVNEVQQQAGLRPTERPMLTHEPPRPAPVAPQRPAPPSTAAASTGVAPGRAAAAPARRDSPGPPAAGQRTAPSGPPPGGATFEQRDVAAHEMFTGLFTEGASGLGFGIGDFFGQFGRRDPLRQAAVDARIRSYEQNYTADFERRPGESAADHQRRLDDPDLAERAAAVALAQQQAGLRAFDPPPTAPASPSSPASPVAAPSGEVAHAPGAAPEAADGPAPAPAAGGGAAGAVTAARALATAVAASPAVPSPSAAVTAMAATSPTDLPQRAREVPGAHPDDVLARLDEADLEDLAGMLYGRLRTRLRRELLIDRERSGLLTDFR